MIEQNVTQASFQNPYEEFTRVIAAGASEEILFAHSSFAVLNLSGGALAIRVGQTGQRTSVIGGGMGFEWIDGEGRPLAVASVRLFNIHASEEMTVTIGLAMGRIKDARLTFTGTMNIQNTSATAIYVRNMTGDALAVADTAVDASVQLVEAAVDDVTAALASATAKRNGLTALGTYGGQIGAGTTTFVTAVANANGVILHHAQVGAGTNATSVSTLNVGGNRLMEVAGLGANSETRDIFIPAGNALAGTVATSGNVLVNYTVL